MTRKLNEIEERAVNDIVGKKKANALEKRGIHKSTLLHAYHKADRPYKGYKKMVDATMEELDTPLKMIDKNIEHTKKQLELYDNLKQSLFIDKISKLKK
jgi:hypothetical protein